MQSSDRSAGMFQFAVLILSIYACVALVIDTFFQLSQEVSLLIQLFDTLVCGFFLIDFALQLHRAPDKLAYLKVGWIDLLASIPMIDYLRFARIVRILRIIRVFRAIRATHKIYGMFKERKSVAGSVVLTIALLIMFSSVGVLVAEKGPDSNIKTAGDALWWTFTTISTVGFGDYYPVTLEGRVVAVILMLAGVGMFGSFTALVASWVSKKVGEEEDQNENATLIQEIRALHLKVDHLQAALQSQQTPGGEKMG